MTFNSFGFLVLFPVVLLLYFTLPKKVRPVMLLAASYYFYMAWNFKLIFLILFTTAVSYACALIIEKSEKQSVKKWCLTVTLIVCLGVLFFFKYWGFLTDTASSVVRLFGGTPGDWSLELILPVGISFYTFQTLSYAIDVYRGTVKAEHNFMWYALFVSFFPQLVAGPIERPDNLLPQLKETHEPDIENFSLGLQKMAVGFFKKIVVADLLAGYVNAVYNNVNEATALSVVIATVLFAVQIYCDFSGYTDIAIGCARMMGIRLMQNFNRPYTARSIRDFWDRWHISLSTWLRDYLYIPLGGNRVSRPRYYFNLMVVFLASGLWHGADWTFVLWGAVHGIFRIVGSLTRKPRERLWESLGVRKDALWLVLLQKVNTFALVCFAWIFFRANSIADLSVIFSRLFGAGSWSVSETMTVMGLNTAAIIVTVLSILVLSLLDRVMSRAELETADVASRRMTTVLLVWTVAVAWILLLSVGGASSFIYFQF